MIASSCTLIFYECLLVCLPWFSFRSVLDLGSEWMTDFSSISK